MGERSYPEHDAVRQHIAWLEQFIGGMTDANWKDMKLRAERQLEQLSEALPDGESDLERAFIEICDELGSAYDNESPLIAIDNLKQRCGAVAQQAVGCGVSWRDEDYNRARDCMIGLLRGHGWTIVHGRRDQKEFDNAFQHAVGILALTASPISSTDRGGK